MRLDISPTRYLVTYCQNQGATNSPDGIDQGSIEKCLRSFFIEDLLKFYHTYQDLNIPLCNPKRLSIV